MKKSLICFISIIAFFYSCNTKTKVSDKNNNRTDSVKITNVLNEDITIAGTKVNIRELPGTKTKVLFQLNTGDKCKLLEKGEFEKINGKGDFWYKIKYNEKIGWVYGAFTSIASAPFALIYPENNLIYLFGKYKLNETITLIDNKNGYLFETKTTGYYSIEDDNLGKIEVTKISNQPKKGSEFIATFNKKPEDYRIIEKEKIKVKDEIIRLDKLIRKSNLLDTLLNQMEIEYKADVVLKDIIPDIFMVKAGNKSIYIATYEFIPGQGYGKDFGPRLAVIDDKVFPLTGPCSYENFYVFQMNGKYYIETGSHCCECGLTVVQVFEIDNNQIIDIFADSSFSD